ncbi:Ankyrin repeat domain-containing protein 50, partial [Pseudolycoriella hygida]
GAITFLLDDIEKILGAAYDELETTLTHISNEIGKCKGELHIDVPEKIIKGPKELYIEKLAECLQGINDCYNRDYNPDYLPGWDKKRKITGLLASIQQDIVEILKQQNKDSGSDVQHNQEELYQKSLQYLKKILQTVDEPQISDASSQGVLQYLNKILEVEDKQSTTNIQIREALQFLRKISAVQDKPHSSGIDQQDNDLQQIVRTEHEKYKWHEWFQKTWPRNEQGIILHHNFEQTNKVAKNSSQHDHLLAIRNRLINAYYLQAEGQEAQENKQYQTFTQKEQKLAREKKPPVSIEENILVKKGLLSKEEAPYLDYQIYQIIIEALTPPEIPEMNNNAAVRNNIIAILDNIDVIFKNTKQLFTIVKNLYPGNLDDDKVNLEDQNGNTLLHLAAYKGESNIVEFLLSKGAEVNARNLQGRSPLISAALAEHYNIVEFLLSKGASVNMNGIFNILNRITLLPNDDKVNLEDQNGNTLLHLAASVGKYNMLDSLLLNGAEVNAKNLDGRSPLASAALAGHYDSVEFLLSKGASIDMDGIFNILIGINSLPLKERLEYTNLVKILLDNGKVNSKDQNDNGKVNSKDQNGNTLLHLAASAGEYNIVGGLLLNGAEVNAKNLDGRSPLASAALAGHYNIVECLFARGVNIDMDGIINILISINSLPLKERLEYTNLVKILLDNGKVNSKDQNGNTLLHWAAYKGESNIVESLLSKGAEGRSPLISAARADHYNIVEFLLSKGASVNMNGIFNILTGINSLPAEEPLKYTNLVKILLDNGKVNSKDQNGNTLLHLAASAGNCKIMELLLSKGAEINIQNNNKNTPLHQAVDNQNVEAVKLLTRRGASVSIENNQQVTPLKLALGQTNTNSSKGNLLLEGGKLINWPNRMDTQVLEKIKNYLIGKSNVELENKIKERWIGYYLQDNFGENHFMSLTVGKSREEAAKAAKNKLLGKYEMLHTDNIYNIDECIKIYN